jgi:ABC-2 type transport system ATP-binding protein
VIQGQGPIIETQGLTRRFRGVAAVDALTLTVSGREVFGLVGPDGAGKSTIIRMLCAILDPTVGTARVAGFDTVREAEQVKARIGYMAQRFNLYGDLTVEENLAFFASVFRVSRRERIERTDRLLGFAGLDGFRRRRAGQLSGGMQKKLALACTLIHQPEIVFLDEPTTGVDPVSRRELWDILTELHLQGTTIFCSTPYMDEAERCSRVGLVHQGRMVVCAPPVEIRQLVRGDLLELRAPDLRRAQQVTGGQEGVLDVQTYGDLLHVLVDSGPRRLPALQQALRDSEIEVLSLRQTRPRMEDAFVSLVRRLAGGPGSSQVPQALPGQAEDPARVVPAGTDHD